MKENFRDWKYIPKTKVNLDQILGIVDEYVAENMNLTLRQIYYQMVSRGHVENSEAGYQRVKGIVGKARYAGMMDWEVIVDRTRLPSIPSEWENPTALLETALNAYRLPRLEGQEYYVEVITEKDALLTTIARVATKYHLPANVFRGYTSTTVMYEMSKRISEASAEGKKPVLLYIGDHDPSGLDMLRDVEARQREFLRDVPLTVVHVALTMDQIKKLNPLPNKTKDGDVRSKEYIDQFGKVCWEADALPPKYLKDVLETTILKCIDVEKMDVIKQREESDKDTLRSLIEESKTLGTGI